MSRLRISRIACLAVLALATSVPAAAVTAAPVAAAATTYTVTDLGSLGGPGSHGLAINNNGQVTGYSYIAATIPSSGCCGNCYGKPVPCVTHPYHAFVWSNGTMTDLGTLGGTYSQGLSINSSGTVVGTADTATGSESFIAPYGYTQQTGKKSASLHMIALTGLGAYGINDAGQIAGVCTGNSGSHACLDSNGTITLLPTPSNLTGCGATAINNNGQILGGCGDTSSNSHAVLWQNGTPTDLGTFGGPQATATAINGLGQAVGYAMTSSYTQHGFLWSNGTMTDLGNNFFPAAVNDSGVVVGSDLVYSGGTLQNLNTLIPAGSPYQIDSATAINDNGQIVANAYDTTTHTGQALLLTPS